MIVFEVTPVALTGASPGAPEQSSPFGPILAANSVPVASNVTISGTTQVGNVLSGSYSYSDADGDLEGTSTYRWLRGATVVGTGTSYTLAAADAGATIVFEVTPVALTGASPGLPVASSPVGPIAGAVTVLGVSPNPIAENETIAVTISGSGFASGATLSFENGNGPAPDVAGLVVVSPTEITVSLTVKRAGPPRDRVWDVRVTNTDGGTGVLVGGLTITSAR